jgi:NAD(P)-dependent dehydrogenase (short-subunit alcohol dehydrogenase family)
MKNLFSIEGKVALITGGSRGIGEMIATGFVANGARVYISSRNAEVCEEVASRLSAEGECIALPCDLSNVEGTETLAAALGEREEKLDVLVNNAGAAWGAPLDEYPEKGWDKVMDINLKSPFFLTQKLLPLLRRAATYEDPARVINIASIDGITTPDFPTFAYSSSKAGLIHLTRNLAKHLAGDDVLVNAIAPGPFESKMMQSTLENLREEIEKKNPRRRIGTPEDIAGVAIFLSSRASAYTTGCLVTCDGGVSQTHY